MLHPPIKLMVLYPHQSHFLKTDFNINAVKRNQQILQCLCDILKQTDIFHFGFQIEALVDFSSCKNNSAIYLPYYACKHFIMSLFFA